MLDRTQAPPFVKSTSFLLPKVSKTLLPSGTKILHLPDIAQELAKIEVVFEAGKWFESKPDQSHFTVQMLDKGTKSMSSRQIAEIFDRYGAHIELTSNFDFASVSLYALTNHVALLLPIFFELITAPAFSEVEFEQLKRQFIQALRVKNEKTSYVASKLIRKKIFGPQHPYGQAVEESDVERLVSSDLKIFFDSQMKPSYVFILGRVLESDLVKLTESVEQIGYQNNSKRSFSIPDKKDLIEYIPKDGSLQSSIRLGKSTIQRNHPDYPGLTLLNYYLGGYFGSRLMKNLREDKGLTYGISSSLNSLRYESLVLIGTDVNKENRELAIDEIRNEIKLLKSQINAEELELAKRHFIGSMQGEIASPFSIMSKIKNIELNQLPEDFYQNLIDKIDGLGGNDLIDVARKYYDEESLTQVTVG